MNSKICARCKCEKPLHAFAWRWRAANIRQSSCRDCRRREKRRSYRPPTLRRGNKLRQRDQLNRDKARQFLQQYLATKQCIDCGENDARVLDIELPSSYRLLTARIMIRKGYTTERIQNILELATIRCANCRRMQDSSQF